MRVELLLADTGACSLYRMRLPGEHSGVDIHYNTDLKIGWRTGPGGAELVDAVADADVVVMQRPARWTLAAAVPLLQTRGIAVVVDMDDDFTCLDPANPAWTITDPRSGHGQDRAAIHDACRQADLVTVTTPALARRYAPHGRAVVLPNYVPAAYLSIDGAHDKTGWAGSVATHPNDLQVTRGQVPFGLTSRFHVIGDGENVRRNLGLDHDPTITGTVPLDRYPFEVAELGVGIVPLADTPFNHAKSALKMLEYAALGVDVVASPTPDNQRVHADGIGRLARRPRDWRRLDRDESRVARAREVIRAKHLIDRNAWRWAEAWARALVNRRAVAA